MACTRTLLVTLSLSLFAFVPPIIRADPIGQTLPGASVSGSYTVPLIGQSGSLTSFGSYFNNYLLTSNPPLNEIAVQGTASGGQDPSASSSISIFLSSVSEIGDLNELNPFDAVSALTGVSYSFVVNGPASTIVPIDITAAGGVGGSPISSNIGLGAAELKISSLGSVLLDDSACAGPLASIVVASCQVTYPEPSFSINNEVLDVETNQVYTVNLQADSEVWSLPLPDNPGGVSFSDDAFVDPTITLDPSVGSQYSLTFSSGLTPTPEPNYLPLLILCLGGLMVYGKRARVSQNLETENISPAGA